MNITTLAIIGGGLPARASSMVTEWASLHQQELGAAWEKAKRLQPPGRIQPLQCEWSCRATGATEARDRIVEVVVNILGGGRSRA